MSHIPQRKEKDCLNCGTIVQGKYCQNCGQENVVPKETFWHMFTHFFYDITHFDSSFFHTIHHLIIRPGFLSKEYMAGRRVSYLHPIRMYVFTSAIFFLLFFSFFTKSAVDMGDTKPLDAKERTAYLSSIRERVKKDSTNKLLLERIILFQDTSRVVTISDTVEHEPGEGYMISFGEKNFKTFAEYDSIEKTLPPSERDGWLARRFVKLGISINTKYRENPEEATKKILEGFLHRVPYMLFVSLPLFALILRLVYIRRKDFYFADHGVFTIHLYVFSFINLLVVFSIDELQGFTGWTFLDNVIGILIFGMAVYLYIAMKRFYKQGWIKTFFKFLIVSILSLIMMILLFLIFLVFSAASI